MPYTGSVIISSHTYFCLAMSVWENVHQEQNKSTKKREKRKIKDGSMIKLKLALLTTLRTRGHWVPLWWLWQVLALFSWLDTSPSLGALHPSSQECRQAPSIAQRDMEHHPLQVLWWPPLACSFPRLPGVCRRALICRPLLWASAPLTHAVVSALPLERPVRGI